MSGIARGISFSAGSRSSPASSDAVLAVAREGEGVVFQCGCGGVGGIVEVGGVVGMDMGKVLDIPALSPRAKNPVVAVLLTVFFLFCLVCVSVICGVSSCSSVFSLHSLALPCDNA